MWKQLFILSLICFCNSLNAQSNIDILHYKFELSLSDRNDTIYGSATIKLRFLQPGSSFSVDFISQNKPGKGMKTDSVIYRGSGGIKNFNSGKNKINIFLANTTGENDTALVSIYYHGVPDDGLIISKNKYGQRTFFADNWPNRAHDWIPCIDNLTDKASFEFLVTAPSHYEVISNGELVEEKILLDNNKLTHWKEDTPLSTKLMVIGVADFAVKKYADSPANIPVTAWVFARDSVNGFLDYDPAPNILKFFINYIGPYPYNKLANVQSKTIFGGMENASAIFYAETSVTGYHDLESTLAHEIAHQWFGDMVTEKSFAHLWLSEGFATYLSHIYIESKYGTDSLDHEMQRDRSEIIFFTREYDKPVVDSVSSYMGLLNSNSYQKGSWVLHMLRRQLGESVFQKIMRSFYETYKGTNANSKDFQAIAEKISGKKLDDFFRQWLYTPRIPELYISWKYDTLEKKVVVNVEQLQPAVPFSFPLDISIVPEPGKILVEKLLVTKKTETFIFNINTHPIQIIADPDISLLYEGHVRELK